MKMGTIYKHSNFTIAATVAENCHSGIFRRREKYIWDTFPPGPPWCLEYESTVRNAKGAMYIRTPLDSWTQTVTGVLRRRAWVLQEEALSPRTIHFAKDQVAWSCRSCLTSQGDLTPANLKEEQEDYKRLLFPPNVLVDSRLISQTPAFNSSYQRWYCIVDDYGGRKLTYASDKFPALSGLAKEFQKTLGDDYVAGLWKNDLHRGLLWQITSTTTRVTRPKEYRALSWSWASIDWQAERSIYWVANSMSERIFDFDAKILNVNILLATSDQFGKVEAGVLTLRSRFLSPSKW
jgi:hypothetical protein